MRDQSNSIMEEIDREWVQLLQEAKEMGLSSQEVREFLESSKTC